MHFKFKLFQFYLLVSLEETDLSPVSKLLKRYLRNYFARRLFILLVKFIKIGQTTLRGKNRSLFLMTGVLIYLYLLTYTDSNHLEESQRNNRLISIEYELFCNFKYDQT